MKVAYLCNYVVAHSKLGQCGKGFLIAPHSPYPTCGQFYTPKYYKLIYPLFANWTCTFAIWRKLGHWPNLPLTLLILNMVSVESIFYLAAASPLTNQC